LKETNRNECTAVKAKNLFAEANMVEVNLLQKGTRKNLITKRNIIINSPIPMELTPHLRKRVIVLFVESQAIMHLNLDIGPKTVRIYGLKQDGDELFIKYFQKL